MIGTNDECTLDNYDVMCSALTDYGFQFLFSLVGFFIKYCGCFSAAVITLNISCVLNASPATMFASWHMDRLAWERHTPCWVQKEGEVMADTKMVLSHWLWQSCSSTSCIVTDMCCHG